MDLNGTQTTSKLPVWSYSLRAWLTKTLLGRQCFIHELQLEPWGNKPIWEMAVGQQDQSMGTKHIKQNLAFAKQTGLYPIDLWGAEWWYWRKTKLKDEHIWQTVAKELKA
jgi:hypothetical protein